MTYVSGLPFITLLIYFQFFNVLSQDLRGIIGGDQINTPAASHDVMLLNDYKDLRFDKENSKITFDFVSEETVGSIGGLDFTINLDPDHLEDAFFKGSVLVDELETGNFLRDGHLMWKKFFYEKKYPKITFESTKIIAEASRSFKVNGKLTIKGTTKEIEIDFTLFETELIGKTTIYTSDYNVNIHDERSKNQLNVKFIFPVLKF